MNDFVKKIPIQRWFLLERASKGYNRSKASN